MTTVPTHGESTMSGQHQRPIEPDRPGQADSTLIISEFAGRDQGPANGHHGNRLAQDAAPREAGGPAPDSEVSPGPPDDAQGRSASAPEEREPLPYQAAAATGQPEPGSWADLRQRLEVLPYGHPSSPYHVDGDRKPPPPRLKHLELAPPAREAPLRAVPTDLARPAAAPAGADAPDEAEIHGGPTEPPAHGPADVAPALSPQVPATYADSPRDDRDRGPSMFTPASGRAEQTRSARVVPGNGGADATSPPAGRDRQPGAGHDAPPRIAGDGSWSWGPARLTRDQVRIAEDAYDRFRAAEGRNLFGGYERGAGLTAAMRRVEAEVALGRLAPGTEQHALLSPDVFRAKFADLLRRYPDWTPEQLSRRVPGALTYIFVLEADDYADGIRAIEQALHIQGFQLQARKNSWSSEATRCVLTIWHDPADDLPFQVQFHIAASLEARSQGTADNREFRRNGDVARH